MALMDHITKFGSILIGVAGLAFGVGQATGRNGEVAIVRGDVAGLAARQSAQEKSFDYFRTDVKTSMDKQERTVAKAADDAAATRKLVEGAFRANSTKGHPL